MKLTLTIDIDALSGETPAEIGRILRYWAGAAKQLDWDEPFTYPLQDSSYAEVGSLRVEEAAAG